MLIRRRYRRPLGDDDGGFEVTLTYKTFVGLDGVVFRNGDNQTIALDHTLPITITKLP